MGRRWQLIPALALTLWTARADARSCIDASNVVGEQKCSEYGSSWAIERQLPLTFRFGFRHAAFSPSGLQFNEGYKRRNRPTGYQGYRFDGAALGVPTLSALGFDGGVTVFVAGQLYVGLDSGFAVGTARTASFSTDTHALSDAKGIDVLMFHGGGMFGYRIPLGRVSLRGEMLLGGTAVTVSQSVKSPGVPSHGSAGAGRLLFEPRVAADIWFTQHVSFGAYAGVNLLDTRGHAIGIALTLHARAFDGDMSIW